MITEREFYFWLILIAGLFSFIVKLIIGRIEKIEAKLEPEPLQPLQAVADQDSFIFFPLLCVPDKESELSKMGLPDPAETEEVYRSAFYRRSEIVGFYPHEEKGKTWVELKSGSVFITNLSMKQFKKLLEG